MKPHNYKYNDGSATDNKIKLIIPILVKWARESWDSPHYYADVAKAIGSNPQSVGGWLGLIWSHVIHPRFPFSSAEFITLSQDRIDVLFKTKDTTYAVEVKSEISDDDIVRGVFQAVKYQAVLEAQGKVNGASNDIKSILVIGRKLPSMAHTMAKILDVSVIENFSID